VLAGRWRWIRAALGALIIAAIVWHLGAGPFLDGLRKVDAWSLIAAAGIGVVTTVATAYRWRTVARALGVDLSLGVAVRAYYLSLWLNSTLPGGVVGDVDRAVRHGRKIESVGVAARAVVSERAAGQAVQIVCTLVVLLVLPLPIHGPVLWLVGATVVTALIVWAVLRHGATAANIPPAQAWLGVVLSSIIAIAGYVATFVIAARTAGVTASTTVIIPLALLVLLATAVPTNIGGWGPREGAAAWLFGAAGLGAAQGVSTATVYGVIGLAACAPGLLVLLRTVPRPVAARTPNHLSTGAADG
jgi:uncharacterized membrane protein YbhN (UPF0104 family)